MPSSTRFLVETPGKNDNNLKGEFASSSPSIANSLEEKEIVRYRTRITNAWQGEDFIHHFARSIAGQSDERDKK